MTFCMVVLSLLVMKENIFMKGQNDYSLYLGSLVAANRKLVGTLGQCLAGLPAGATHTSTDIIHKKTVLRFKLYTEPYIAYVYADGGL